MLKQELIKRSPVRVLEKGIHGGLGTGNLGVVTARKGIGKTAVLAHLALDKMMREQSVLHISMTDDPHHVENCYRHLFNELAEIYKLENAMDVFNEMKHHRLIINFKQQDITFDHIRESVKNIEGGMNFKPDTIIVDGRDFDHMNVETLSGWKEFAVNQNAAIWFAAVLHREDMQMDEQHIPAPVNQFKDLFSVIIMLEPAHEYIDMKLLKDHDNPDIEKLRLKLDAQTLLISNHRV
ncbi:hypothetical protein JW948_13615 [bacterium]|nr:hypothetical protein [bacterium]